MSGSDREALTDAREWLGDPPGCSGVVGIPSRMFEKGQESLPDVWQWSGGLPDCQGVVKRPSRMTRIGMEAFRMSGSG